MTNCSKQDNSLSVKIFESTKQVYGFKEWYNKNQSRLFQITRAEILREEPALQKAIFVNLPPEVKLRIWKDRLSSILKNNLTKSQNEFIEKVFSNLNRDMFDFSSPNIMQNYRYFNEIKDNAINLFGKGGGYIAFASLGPTELIVDDPNAASNDCGCSSKSDWCVCGPDPFHCKWCQSGDGCKSSSWGCGTFWAYACNGNCSAKGYRE